MGHLKWRTVSIDRILLHLDPFSLILRLLNTFLVSKYTRKLSLSSSPARWLCQNNRW